MAEKLVHLQLHALLAREVPELLVVRIGRNLGDRTNAGLTQSPEKPYQPGIGILEAAGIDELYPIQQAIIKQAVKFRALTEACHYSCAIVCQEVIVNITASMTIFCKAIRAEMNLMSILTKALYLAEDFLRYTARITEAVID